MEASNSPLSIDERRQLTFASLLRYAPEAVPLRDRILERMILSALLGSTSAMPYRIGRIQSALTLAPSCPLLRPEHLQAVLKGLIQSGKVQQTEVLKRHAYYLTEAASDEVASMVGSGEDMFRPVLMRMLEHSEHLLPRSVGESICRTFISECFALFGLQIAKTVTGRLTASDILKYADAKAAFAAAVNGHKLSPECLESLSSRCISFLSSTDPDDVRLKFHLSQGYFFAQLIGFCDTKYEILTESAFRGAVLFLDTNVAILGLLRNDRLASQFDELLAVAKRLGIELRITRATVNEIRRVIASRVQQAEKLFGVLPEEVIERSDDQFINAYIDALNVDRTLTPKAFFEPIELVSDSMETLGISVVESEEDDLIRSRDFSREADVLQEAFNTARGFEKSQDILTHDLAHYALILDERATHALTWFLTRDRSLPVAAAKLKGDALFPFCYTLIGFLQTVSPFLISGKEEQGFAGIFSALIKEQILPREQLFNLRELTLLVEMHQDVISTPKEKLIAAIDYVKSAVLQGQAYRIENRAEVALGLRSYLASSSEEQIIELEKEHVRLDAVAKQEAQVAVEERRLRLMTESAMRSQVEQLTEYQEQTNEQSVEISALKDKIASEDRAKRRRTTIRAALFLLIGYLLIWFRYSVTISIEAVVPALKSYGLVPKIVLAVGWILVVADAAFYLRRAKWPDQGRVGLMAVLLVAGYGLSGGFENTPIVSTAALCGLVAGALVLGFTNKLTSTN